MQAYHHPNMTETLIHLVCIELNEILQQVFMIPLSVRCSHFVPLVRNLTTGYLRENTVYMPGG